MKLISSMVFGLAVTLAASVQRSAASDQAYDFITLAGMAGQAGNILDGTIGVARFYDPLGVAADNAGNLYVADSNNCAIRKITPDGVVTTLAGQASVGSNDGTGGAARFNYPTGVAVDGAGNVYVADTGNSTIRKITPDGVVTTLAGLAGQVGSSDGTGGAARFNYPLGVAVDGADNVYVADTRNSTIRKITTGGAVTTLAGQLVPGSSDGTGNAAQFTYPAGVAVDSAGNLYVADTGDQMIRKITAGGVVTTLAGLAYQAGSSATLFHNPEGVTVDSAGNVYVADTNNNTIREITPNGVVTTLAGLAGQTGGSDGVGNAARFHDPFGVAVDSAGNVYVADCLNETIRKVTSDGVVSTPAGLAGLADIEDGTGGTARFYRPAGVALDNSGNVYVADANNHTIRAITPNGVVTTLAGMVGQSGSADGTGGAARFFDPSGVAADSAGNVYVADSANNTIRKITPGGVVTTLAGLAGILNSGSRDGTGGAARFYDPIGVAVDGAGNVYVADFGNNTIRKITPGGVVTTLAGLAGSFNSGSSDGTGGAARFDGPSGVAVDGAGNIYVADTDNNTIREITPGGVVTTLAGQAGQSGGSDGTGGAARFYKPSGVAVDGAGALYVADAYNHTIRKITPSGVVTTVAGLAGQPGSSDGTGGAAQFDYPSGVAVDGAGALYVADTENCTIRKGGFAPDFTTLPVPQTVAAGQTVVFAAGSEGTAPLSYQWSFNGTAITGATDAYLVLSNTQAAGAGSYTCTVTNEFSSVTSAAAALMLSTSIDLGRIMNVSIRNNAGAGDNQLIAGFVIGGTGNDGSSKTVLVRGDGPLMSDFGLAGVPDPLLNLFQPSVSTTAAMYSNQGWNNSPTITSVGTAVGAYPFDANSLDSALAPSLAPGAYTANITGASGDTGVALAEVYDATTSFTATTPRLVNVSGRCQVGAGDNQLIAGFVIGGSTEKTVLVRGVGPLLASLGLTGTLPDPMVSVYQPSVSTTVPLASNTVWGGDAAISTVAGAVGAYPFASSDSADSALLISLPPGAYTANVTGASGDTGVVLVEVYEVP